MSSRKLRRRPSLVETLESRRLLSTSIWTGTAGDHLFSDPNNWQGGVAPSSGDDIQFNDIGTPQTVDVDSAATVGNLYISGTYAISNHALTLLGDVTANANANVVFSNSITITTNSHFTVDTDAKLQLGTLNDSSSDTLDKYDSGELVLAGNSNSTWNLLDDGTMTLAANTHIDLYQYGGTLNGSGSLDSISSSNVQNSVISPSNSSGPTTITSASNTYIDGGSVDITLNSNSSYGKIINQANAVSLMDSPTLNVALGSGFVPAAGATFDIINSEGGAINGTFAGLAEGATFTSGGERFSISYVGGGGNEVVLTALGTTPTVGLSSSSTSQTAGVPITLTATLAGSTGAPSGTVTFRDGSSVLGTSSVSSSGVATFTTSSLSAGPHSITASYGGNSENTSAASSAVSITINSSSVHGITFTTPAAASVLTAKAATLSAVASDSSATLDNGLKYTWSVVIMPSGAKTPIFSLNATHAASTVTASFSKDGTYHFRVTVTDTSGNSATSDVDYLVHQKARGLRITPHGATIKNGTSLQYTTTALDQFGHPMRVSGSPTYTLVQGSGSVSSTGLFTAGSTDGRITLDVLLDGIEGSSAGTVA